jgi:hypothetical protein
MMNDFKQAMNIIEPFAVRMGWTFEHDPQSADMLIAMTNMMHMEENDELPAHIRPAYRVVIHSFAKLFERIEGEDDE